LGARLCATPMLGKIVEVRKCCFVSGDMQPYTWNASYYRSTAWWGRVHNPRRRAWA